MPTGEVPQYPEILALSQEMSGNFSVLEGYLTPERRRLEERTSRNLSDEVVIASLFMKTGAEYIRGITAEALHNNESTSYYPGGIRYQAGSGFRESTENEQRIIMLNYTAAVYGLAVQMIDEMIQSKQGIFLFEEFAARYNLLMSGTAYPHLELKHLPKQVVDKIHPTDYGPGEILPYQDMQVLIKAYKEFGVPFLFDNNSQHSKLPASLLWFFQKQGLTNYLPTIHQEARKHLNAFQTGRRTQRDARWIQMRHDNRAEKLLSSIEGLDLDLTSNPHPETSEE